MPLYANPDIHLKATRTPVFLTEKIYVIKKKSVNVEDEEIFEL
jgi:hypothetical protein